MYDFVFISFLYCYFFLFLLFICISKHPCVVNWKNNLICFGRNSLRLIKQVMINKIDRHIFLWSNSVSFSAPHL